MNQASDWHLLRDVSRSFYLTLRVLPRTIRRQVGLAYLLARTSDTIADTGLVGVDKRLAALAKFRARVLGKSDEPLDLGELEAQQGSRAERSLLEKIEPICAALEVFEPADQERIREVFAVITSGQELDLRRFGHASASQLSALPSDEDLDDYTYRVAGCVGEFWTRMCRTHVFPGHQLDDVRLLDDGIRFGKGLQLVNILRDLAVDLQMGRCYMPKDKLHEAGLTANDLLTPSTEPRFAPVARWYLDRAEDHLRAGWRYTNSIPFSCWRVRLACSWPALIGIRTLQQLRTANLLDPSTRIKISRHELRIVLVRSLICYPLPRLWQRLLDVSPHCHVKPVA